MKKTKRVLALTILTIALMIGLTPSSEVSGASNSSVDINIVELASNPGVYEMTVTATTTEPVKQFEIVLSYNNSLVQAVSSNPAKTLIDISDGDNQNNNPGLGSHATNPVEGEFGEIYTKAIAAYLDGNRTAIYYAYASATGVAPENTVLFKSYFRLMGSTTEADFNISTFNIETDQNGFLSRCLAAPDRYGVRIGYGGDLAVFDNYDGDNDPLALTFAYPNSDKLITPIVSEWPSSSQITYGESLNDSVLTGGSADVLGTFSWAIPSIEPAVSDSDITAYDVTFTPADTANYSSVNHPTGLTLAVNKASITKPTVTGTRIYTGVLQESPIATNDAYKVTGSATDVGTYSATVSLVDTANTYWTDETVTALDLSWTIDPADYGVSVPSKNIKVGSPNSLLPGALTTGVNLETPAGTLSWYASEASRISGTAISENYISTLTLGSNDANKDYTLYWRFQSSDGNYVNTTKEGSTNITIINGNPQNIEITGKPGTVTYGDPNFTLGAIITTTGDSTASFGEVTWDSSNTSVATINATTGEVDVLSAGTTTIKAMATAVPGEYAAGSKSYVLTVNQLPLTVAVGTFTVIKVYDGTTNPGIGSGDLSVTGVLDGDLVIVTGTPQNYTSKNVGEDTNVNVALSLSGDHAGNYSLLTDKISVPCSITQKEITDVSVPGVTKTYDGTTAAGDARVDGTVTLTGKIDGDNLDINLTIGSFNDANVGTVDNRVSIALGTLIGGDSGNYSLLAGLTIINSPGNILPATITSIETAAPTEAILANNTWNISAENLKANAITLPGNVTVNYAGGTASLPIIWADAEEAYNKKGGTYTYKGTVNHGSNFNAYSTTLDATLTVTPVTITNVATVPGTLTLAKSNVADATSLTTLGFPAQVTLSFNNAVSDMDIDSAWDKTIAEIQTIADGVDENTDQTTTVTLTDTNFPSWATFSAPMPSTEVTITFKLVIPEADIAFSNATITYGGVLNQIATVDLGTYTDAEATYSYMGNGSTSYGPSTTEPVDVGTYNVLATVQNDTHKGSKSASLTINPKPLDLTAIAPIADQTYTGGPLTPVLMVTDGGTPLVMDQDYTASYSSNTNAGTGSVTVTGIGNHTGTASQSFAILPKDISVVSITADNQTYDGSPKIPTYIVKDGETTLTLGTDFTFVDYSNNTNAGAAVINIAGKGNYTGTITGNFTINKAGYDMSGVTFADASKEYNGEAQNLTIAGTLPTGADDIPVTVSYSGSARNVNEGTTTITAIFATTSTNYNVPSSITAFITITPKEVTVGGITAADKTYDGTTTAVINTAEAIFTGKIDGDTLTVNTTGTFDSKNVGLNKTVALGALNLAGPSADNYVLAAAGSQTETWANLVAKEVTIDGITAESKTYDGTNIAVVNTVSAVFTGKIAEDTLTVNTTGTFDNKNVGQGKTVALGPLSLVGANAENYSVKSDSQSVATADITAKEVTINGITAADKVYDGTTAAAINTAAANITGIESGDMLTVKVIGAFDNKNVGLGKTVAFEILSLEGTSAGNYSVKADSQTATTADIMVRGVTISGITSNDKIYDGTNVAVINTEGTIFSNKIDEDILTVNTTGTFADAGVGVEKIVTFGILTLSGDDAGNYGLDSLGSQLNTTATISKREVVVSGLTVSNKIYDGSTTATVETGLAIFENKLTADSLSVTASGNFVDKNVASDKIVTLSSLILGGSDFTNYVLAVAGNQATAAANILAKEVIVNGITAGDKTYDGTDTAVINTAGAIFAGIIDGDALTINTTGTFADANAELGKTVTFGPLTLAGASVGNYTLAAAGNQTGTTATINKASQGPLNLSLDKDAILVGNTLTASSAGGDGDGAINYSITPLTGNGTVSASTITATSAGTINVVATKAASTNYNAITSMPITVTIENKMVTSSRAIVKDDITDPGIKVRLVNEGKYTIGPAIRASNNVNHFIIEVKATAALTSYENLDPAKGSGRWIGCILGDYKANDGAATGTTGVWYSDDGINYTQFTSADLTEVQSVGGVDGEFIFWIKSEEIGATVDKYIANDSAGANATKITINFTDYAPLPTSGSPRVTPPVIVTSQTSGSTTTVTTTVLPRREGLTAIASITNRVMDSAVNRALEDSTSQGTNPNITLLVPVQAGTEKVITNIPKTSIETLIEGNPQGSLTVESSLGLLTFSGQALQAISSQALGEDIQIIIEVVDKKTLEAEQKGLVGNNLVIDLTVRSGNRVISNFNGGSVTVRLPYKLRIGQNPEYIVVWFMNDEGILKKFESQYNEETAMVSFVTDHFSKYVIAYFPFEDVPEGAWYYENTVYVYGNDLMKGTSMSKFSPKEGTTRGMVVTVLWRMEGQPRTKAHSFNDVHRDWYNDAISWASANGIVSGYGNDRFGPDDYITREQMAKTIYQYSMYKGYTMEGEGEIDKFVDVSDASKWAHIPLKWAVGNGIISGTGQNRLDPTGGAQRAQVAAILQRFIENIEE